MSGTPYKKKSQKYSYCSECYFAFLYKEHRGKFPKCYGKFERLKFIPPAREAGENVDILYETPCKHLLGELTGDYLDLLLEEAMYWG